MHLPGSNLLGFVAVPAQLGGYGTALTLLTDDRVAIGGNAPTVSFAAGGAAAPPTRPIWLAYGSLGGGP